MDLLASFDQGSGTALLFIHGFPLHRGIWMAQTRALAAKFRVINADLRGFGESPAGGALLTMDDQARDLLALMDSKKIDRFIPVGHSMGGYILFALHRLAPQRMEGAVLVSTRAGADSDEGRKNREAQAVKVLAEGTGATVDTMTQKLFGPGAVPTTVAAARSILQAAKPASVAAALRGMAARPDSTPQLARFGCPTLILHGEHDALIAKKDAEPMRAIPASRWVHCPNSGHMPMMEEPDLVSGSIRDFIIG